MLYFIPPAPPPPGAAAAASDLSGGYISAADTVVSLADGAAFLTFDGIHFAHARGTVFGSAPKATVANITGAWRSALLETEHMF